MAALIVAFVIMLGQLQQGLGKYPKYIKANAP